MKKKAWLNVVGQVLQVFRKQFYDIPISRDHQCRMKELGALYKPLLCQRNALVNALLHDLNIFVIHVGRF